MVEIKSESVSGNSIKTIFLESDFHISKTREKIILDGPYKSIILRLENICFVEVLGRIMEIHTKERFCYKMKFKLDDYSQFINKTGFVQVDEYLLINFNRINKYQVEGIPYIELDNGCKKRINPMYHDLILRNIKKIVL